MSRKTLLMWIMVIFIIGNGIAAVATSFTILIIARLYLRLHMVCLCQLDLQLLQSYQRINVLAHCDYVYWINSCDYYWCANWNVYRSTIWLESVIYGDCCNWNYCFYRNSILVPSNLKMVYLYRFVINSNN